MESVKRTLSQLWLQRLLLVVQEEELSNNKLPLRQAAKGLGASGNDKSSKNNGSNTRVVVYVDCLASQMELFLQDLCLKSMQLFRDWMLSMDSSEKCDSSHTTGFLLTLKATSNGKVKMVPSVEEVENMAMDVFELMVRTVTSIPRLDSLLFNDMSHLKLRPTIPKDEVTVLKQSVLASVARESDFATTYIHVFEPFLCLINGDAEREVSSFLSRTSPQPSFEELMSHITRLRLLSEELKCKFAPDSPHSRCEGRMFRVHKDDLVASLMRRVQTLKDRVVQRLSLDHQSHNRALCCTFESISETALTSPTCTSELVTLRNKVVELRLEVDGKLTKELEMAAKRIGWLADYLQFTTADVKLNIKTFQWHARMKGVFEENEAIMLEKSKQFQTRLREKQAKFAEELDNVNNMVDDFYTLSNLDDMPRYSERLHSLEQRLSSCEDKMSQFASEESAFGWETTSYPVFEETSRRLSPFVRLHSSASSFLSAQQTWLKSHMGSHDPEAIEQEVRRMWQEVSSLESDFERNNELPESFKSVVQQVKERMQTFLERMPIVRTLGNPGLRERHWEQISHTVGFPVNPESTLAQILDMGLDESVSKFAKISHAASMEFRLETGLQDMEAAWSRVQLHLAPYPNSSTFTFSDMEEVHTLLDDHLVQLQTMKGSLHVAFFESQIASRERRLTTLADILDVWLGVQTEWRRLEPLFSSAEVVAQMPEEGRRFATVDKTWRDLMKAAALVQRDVLKVLEIERILERLRKSTELLQLIAKGLKEFLQIKRKAFPRCFFLSDNAMLAMLAETNEPTRVQRHLTRCFEGMKALVFDTNNANVITHFVGPDHEHVRLREVVDTALAKGQVDQWLLALEKQMRVSLAAQITSLHKDKNDDKKDDKNDDDKNDDNDKSDDDSPCEQAKTCVLWLSFKLEVDQALASRDPTLSLSSLSTICTSLYKELIERHMQSTMGFNETLALKNLILARGFMLKTVNQLLRAEEDRTFIWHCKLKYVYHCDEVVVEVGDHCIPYGYEYLATQPRLVITSETERCFSILAMAFNTNRVGSVLGESAVGKTRTVQDLARAAARQCVTFNCSREFGAKAFLRFVKGVVGCGAWVCFDQMHLVSRQVLSRVAGQVMRLVTPTSKLINFDDGTSLEMQRGGAIFATGEAEHRRVAALPLLPVAMALPEADVIAEMELEAAGFQHAAMLAQKLASTSDLCDGLLSSQPHYELSLHAVLAVVRAAIRLRHELGNDTIRLQDSRAYEESLVARALHSVKLSELLPQDQSMFRRMLRHLFGFCSPDPLPDAKLSKALISACSELSLQATDELLSKVQQLQDMLKSDSVGVMLLGEPFGGKTSAWSMLAKALGHLNMAPEVVVVNPKAVTLAELFGQGDDDDEDEDDNDNHHNRRHAHDDGILARTLRQFAQCDDSSNNDKESESMKWIVFDGPVDPEWIENLNTMLDENRQLCLMSGEMVSLPARTHLIFEALNLEHATPATISRCGVLYMDAAKLPWQHLVLSWLRRREKEMSGCLLATLKSLATHLLMEPMLKWMRERKEKVCKLDVVSEHQMVLATLNLLQAFLTMPHGPGFVQESKGQGGESKRRRIENNMAATLADKLETDELSCRRVSEAIFLFSLIWSMGAVCHEQGKMDFQLKLIQLHQQLSNEGKLLFPLPDLGAEGDSSLFDFKLNCMLNARDDLDVAWRPWHVDVANIALPRDASPTTLIVANRQMARVQQVMGLLLQMGVPLMLIGESGCGKSVLLEDLLQRGNFVEKDRFREVTVALTAISNARHLRMAITEQLEKRRKGVLGPPLGKRLLVHLDHVNAPLPDQGGAQSSLELVRMALNGDAWYYPEQNACLKLVDISFVASMQCNTNDHNEKDNGNAGGEGEIWRCSRRFLRHFNLLYVDRASDSSVMSIFGRLLLWHLDLKGFGKEFDSCIHQIVSASMSLHASVKSRLRLTLRNPHYLFNLRDVANLMFGVLLSNPETMHEGLLSMKRLWVHEATRVYADKLNDHEHRLVFTEILRDATHTHLDVKLDTHILDLKNSDGNSDGHCPSDSTSESDVGWLWSRLSALLYADFVPDALGPSQNDSHDADSAPSDSSSLSKLYKQVSSRDRLRREAEIRLEQLNARGQRTMCLVLFDSAIQHLCRLVRWLKQPKSHVILVGLGGSGRQSLSRLASHIAEQTFHWLKLNEHQRKTESSVEIGSSNGLSASSTMLEVFRHYVSDLLYQMSCDEHSADRHHVLFVYASQVSQLVWHELNNLVSTGQVSELFTGDMEERVLNKVQSWMGDNSTKQKKADLLNLLGKWVKQHLHLVMAFDPFSGHLGSVLQRFPDLAGRAVVHWMPQWPHTDLHFITRSMWNELTNNTNIVKDDDDNEAEMDNLQLVASLSVFCHESTIALASRARATDGVQTLVTPAAYLEMTQLCVKSFVRQSSKLLELRHTLQSSLDTLKVVESRELVRMQEDLESLQPRLESVTTVLESTQTSVEACQSVKTEVEKSLREIESTLKEKREQIEHLVKSRDSQFEEAHRQMDHARALLAELAPNEIVSMAKSLLKNTSQGVRGVLEAVFLTLKPLNTTKNILQMLESGGMTNKTREVMESLWVSARGMVSEADFLPNVIHFSRQNVNARVAKVVREKYLSHTDLSKNNFGGNGSVQEHLLKGLVAWLRAIDAFDLVTKSTQSQSDQLEIVERECQQVNVQLQEGQAKVDEVEEQLKTLNQQLVVEMRNKSDIESSQDALTRKLERAQQIVATFENIQEEHEMDIQNDQFDEMDELAEVELLPNAVGRWRRRLQHVNSRLQSLRGDLLLASAYIAYLGPFPYSYRMSQLSLWQQEAHRLGLRLSREWSLEKALSLPMEKEETHLFLETCHTQHLPRDQVARDNALIMATSSRYIMLADPHCLATNFLRKNEGVLTSSTHSSTAMWTELRPKAPLKVLRQTDSDFMPSLETGIQLGHQVLIEDVKETLHAELQPLLQKHTFQRGDTLCIRLGDTTLEYHDNFSLLMATRLAHPRFEAEVVSTLNVINFELTEKGMKEQLLELVVNKERPELAEELLQMAKQMSDTVLNMRVIDTRMLSILALGHRSLLEDETAVKELMAHQSNCMEIVEKLRLMQKAKKRLQGARNMYERLANFLVSLFHRLLDKLHNLNHLYRFGLNWLTHIVGWAVETAEKNDDSHIRMQSIQKLILERVLTHVARGVRQDDHLVVDVLLGIHLELLPPHQISRVANMANMAILDLTDDDNETVEENQMRLKHELESILNHYCHSVRVHERLGGSRVLSSELVAEANPHTPILLMLDLNTGMNEVCHEIKNLSHEMALKRVEIVTMAQGEPCRRVRALLTEMSSNSPGWLVLINCQLVSKFVENELEPACHRLQSDAEQLHPDFRLFVLITIEEEEDNEEDENNEDAEEAEQVFKLPVPLLKQSMKTMLEQPSELVSNAHFFMTKYEHLAKDKKALSMLRKLLAFHSIVNYRRSLSQCGWNHEYIFDLSTLDTCQKFVRRESLNMTDVVIRRRLQFLVTKCVYGGCMLDQEDRDLLEAIFEHVFNLDDQQVQDILQGHLQAHQVLQVSRPVIEHRTLREEQELQKRLSKALRSVDLTTSSTTTNTKTTTTKTTLSTQLWSDDESWKRALVSSLDATLSLIPESFDLAASRVSEDVEESESILSLVLEQELHKYNCLLEEMRSSLVSSKHMIQGVLAFDSNLAQLIRAHEHNELPQCWSKAIYLTLETLDKFLVDLRTRVDFLKQWQRSGSKWPRRKFWLAPFFEPGDLIIALTYIASVKAGSDFHSIEIVCRPMETDNDYLESNVGDFPSLLVSDLYLVGGSWNRSLGVLEWCSSNSLFCTMPVLRLMFKRRSDVCQVDGDQREIKVALYQNSERRGEDNFICHLNLPVSPQREGLLHLSAIALLCQRPRG